MAYQLQQPGRPGQFWHPQATRLQLNERSVLALKGKWLWIRVKISHVSEDWLHSDEVTSCKARWFNNSSRPETTWKTMWKRHCVHAKVTCSARSAFIAWQKNCLNWQITNDNTWIKNIKINWKCSRPKNKAWLILVLFRTSNWPSVWSHRRKRNSRWPELFLEKCVSFEIGILSNKWE